MNTNENVESFISESKVHEAVEVLKKVAKVNQDNSNKKQLFENDINFVYLQFNLKKVPINFSTFIHYISLPHHWRHELHFETCLIVKDLNKKPLTDRDADLEQTRDFYRNILNEHSVSTELICEILPMRQLRTEFQLPALRKKLSNEYNAFLCDRKLINNKNSFLSRFLGKAFWIDNKKVPIRINLEDENLKDQIEDKLNQTSLYISGKGSTLSICVGSLQQDSEKLTKNLMVVLQKVKQLFSNNIRELSIKTERSMAILFYMDLGSANEITINQNGDDKRNQFVEDEFDFLNNSNVRVFKDGRIRIIKRTRSENQDEIEDDDEIKTIKSINSEPDDEHWNRHLVFKMPRHIKKAKFIHRKPKNKTKNLN